ncbi:COX4, subunit IV of cytochrome c oxidase [Crepidotus variabilis]|uniref:COX4, subunit IV of cytochrome c oxidase n=1 Tax=Crepidotus variabilis TaxID=179855 RepID=A0A9P6JUD0_9AGAR|nr:COX4, subunit IV of cytochrome c oxidase [Crepidotus variabilis]
MQALRLARQSTTAVLRTTTPGQRKCLATATVNHTHLGATTSSSASSSSGRIAPIPISNIEAQWEKFSSDEKISVHEQLEVLQQKDWKELSLDEKKAAYYVAFGPHGPRAPTSKPGDGLKIFLSTVALIGAAGVVFLGVLSISPPPPKTMTKEWQEASNERAKEMKLNPITGITSEGYQGKGYVQSK